MPSEVASGEKPAVLIIGGLGSSDFRCYPCTQGSTNTKTQDTPGGTSQNTCTTTVSPPKFVSSTNISQSLHGSHQSSRKPAQESASSKLMLHKNVRSNHHHASTGRSRVRIRLTSTPQDPSLESSTAKAAYNSTMSSTAAVKHASRKKKKSTNCAPTISPSRSAAKPPNAR
jgi:hypothetical protein